MGSCLDLQNEVKVTTGAGEGFTQCGLVTNSKSVTQRVCSIQMPKLCSWPMESGSLGMRLQPTL